MWEMPPVSEQSCLRKSVKKKLATALCLMLPSLVPQMNASQLRKWMNRGGRMSPMSTCAGWRKPSGEQRDRLFLVSLSHPAHPRHLPSKQIQKDKSPFYGKGKVEIASFFFFLSGQFLEQFQVRSKIKRKIQGFSICFLPTNIHSLPHYQQPPQEWYVCYSW